MQLIAGGAIEALDQVCTYLVFAGRFRWNQDCEVDVLNQTQPTRI